MASIPRAGFPGRAGRSHSSRLSDNNLDAEFFYAVSASSRASYKSLSCDSLASYDDTYSPIPSTCPSPHVDGLRRDSARPDAPVDGATARQYERNIRLLQDELDDREQLLEQAEVEIKRRDQAIEQLEKRRTSTASVNSVVRGELAGRVDELETLLLCLRNDNADAIQYETLPLVKDMYRLLDDRRGSAEAVDLIEERAAAAAQVAEAERREAGRTRAAKGGNRRARDTDNLEATCLCPVM